MIRLDDIRLFVQVASTNSFTAAARDANVLPSQVSVAVKRLEVALGVDLFVRSTRSVKLTRKGENYLPHARDILSTVRMSLDSVRRKASGLEGELTVCVPPSMARHPLAGWLASFHRHQPRLRMRLFTGQEMSDSGNPDAEIRHGLLSGSNARCEVIAAHNSQVLVASPAYVAAMGLPASVDALTGRSCLVAIDPRQEAWHLQTSKGGVEMRLSGTWCSDDGELLLTWARHGLGIALRPWLEVADDLTQGSLVRLLPDIVGEAMPLAIVTRPHGDMEMATDMLAAHLRKEAAAFLDKHKDVMFSVPPIHHPESHPRFRGGASLPLFQPNIPRRTTLTP